jgi:hypothetical protein
MVETVEGIERGDISVMHMVNSRHKRRKADGELIWDLGFGIWDFTATATANGFFPPRVPTDSTDGYGDGDGNGFFFTTENTESADC